jgi:hypothetical protein
MRLHGLTPITIGLMLLTGCAGDPVVTNAIHSELV